MLFENMNISSGFSSGLNLFIGEMLVMAPKKVTKTCRRDKLYTISCTWLGWQ